MKEEGCGNRELIPGGREVAVTANNIFEYIRRYTEYRLIKSQEKALEVSPQYCRTRSCIISHIISF